MPSANELLVYAARAGNADRLREHIAAGADPSHYDARYGAALFEAIRCHHLGAVDLLLHAGADVQMRDSHGEVCAHRWHRCPHFAFA